VAALGATYVSAQRSPADVQLLASLVLEVSRRLSSHLGFKEDASVLSLVR